MPGRWPEDPSPGQSRPKRRDEETLIAMLQQCDELSWLKSEISSRQHIMRHTLLNLGKLRSACADRKVATKIGLGFACTLVISGLAFGVVWFTFRSVDNGFDQYTQQVAAADTVRDL